jgi:hypothetical protein
MWCGTHYNEMINAARLTPLPSYSPGSKSSEPAPPWAFPRQYLRAAPSQNRALLEVYCLFLALNWHSDGIRN